MLFAGNKSSRLRAWNVAACLIAVLAMGSSAVAACACNHHQSQVNTEDKPSCHGAAHSEPAAEAKVGPDSDSLDQGCSCFVSSRVPAITAKSESKKFSGEKVIASVETTASIVPVLLHSYSALANLYEAPDLYYSASYLTSWPSRAPPRL